MKKITVIIQPFDMKQQLFVYEDGNQIGTNSCKIDNLPEVILTMTQDYDTQEVGLVGPKHFLKGLKKKIETEEMTRFSQNKLNITII